MLAIAAWWASKSPQREYGEEIYPPIPTYFPFTSSHPPTSRLHHLAPRTQPMPCRVAFHQSWDVTRTQRNGSMTGWCQAVAWGWQHGIGPQGVKATAGTGQREQMKAGRQSRENLRKLMRCVQPRRI